MKKILRLLMVIMICLSVFVLIRTNTVKADDTVTVTYNANGGTFDGGATTNEMSYVVNENNIIRDHSTNLLDDGTYLGGYTGNTYGGSPKGVPYTIEGAESLHVYVVCGCYSYTDPCYIIPGTYTNYIYSSTNLSSLPEGTIKLSPVDSGIRKGEYEIPGDTVSIAVNDNSAHGTYGHYITIIADSGVVGGSYVEPTNVPDGKRFVGWNTQADGRGIAYYGEFIPQASMTLYAQYESDDVLASGFFRNVSWRVMQDGSLIIGRIGEEQTYSDAVGEIKSSRAYPWNSYDITSISFEGTVHGTGDMSYMFGAWHGACSQVDMHGFDSSGVTNMDWFFSGCGNDYTWETSGPYLTFLHLDEMDVSNVKSMERMFEEVGVTSLDLSSWDVSSVENFDDMFLDCGRVTSIDVTGWDTSSATSMYRMFGACTSIEEIKGHEDFDTTYVTNLAAFFMSDEKLKYVDVSKWDTGNNEDFSDMFSDCSSLTEIDVSHFNVYHGTYFGWMFSGCNNVLVIDTSHWNAANVTQISQFVMGCSKIEEIDLTGMNLASAVDNQYGWGIGQMFDGCTNLKRVGLPDSYKFIPTHSNYARDKSILPTPSSEYPYLGKWVREDREYGPYTPAELQTAYNEELWGYWVWDKEQTLYTITFEAEGAAGSMTPVKPDALTDYTLPKNQFVKYGFEFDHWDDGNGHEFSDKAVIPANTYTKDDEITFIAVWVPRDTSLAWNGNEATFKIKGGEQAVIDNIPAGTSYQVYELTPDGWVLVQQENSSGVIEALEESAAAFWNKYQPGVTTVQFSGLKNLDGHPADAGKFTFELYEGDTLIDSAETQDGGFIQFRVIEYDNTMLGEHVYTIYEVDPNDDSIDYDTHEETVTVNVVDNGDGTLSSTVTYDDDGIVFENATRPGRLRITKDAENGTDVNADDTFIIEIEFRNESGMPISDDIYWYIEGSSN